MPFTLTNEPNRVSSVKNEIVLSADADPLYTTFYDYKFTILLYTGPGQVVLEYDLYPDADGKIVQDFSRILRSWVSPFLPDLLNIDQIQQATGIISPWLVTLQEWTKVNSGDPWSLTQSWTSDPDLKVVLAGFEDLAGQYLQVFFDNGRFLTFQNQGLKWTYHLLPEFLYFPTPDSGVINNPLHLKGTYYTASGSGAINPGLSQTVSNGEIWVFPAGYGQSQLDLDSLDPNILYYQLWVEDNLGTVVSEVKTYWLETGLNWPFTYRILYENGLGGIDSFYFTGKADIGFLPEAQEIELITSPLAAKNNRRQRQSYNNKSLDSLLLRTLLKPGEGINVKDLLNTTKVWVMYPAQNLLSWTANAEYVIPMKVRRANKRLFKTGANVNELVLALESSNFNFGL